MDLFVISSLLSSFTNIICVLAYITVTVLCSIVKNTLVGFVFFLHFFLKNLLLLEQACCYCSAAKWIPRYGCGMHMVLQPKKILEELLLFSVWVVLTSSMFWMRFGQLKRGDKKGIADIC